MRRMQPRTHLLLQKQNRAVTRSCKKIASLTCAQHSCDNVFLFGIPLPAPRRVAGLSPELLQLRLAGFFSRRCPDGFCGTTASRDELMSMREKPNSPNRPRLAFGAFLFYPFTPLTSNYLSIVYGLTALRSFGTPCRSSRPLCQLSSVGAERCGDLFPPRPERQPDPRILKHLFCGHPANAAGRGVPVDARRLALLLQEHKCTR